MYIMMNLTPLNTEIMMMMFRHYLPNINRDIEFYIGMDAQENFNVIDIAKADPKNLWFHVENSPSNHCVAIIPPDIKKKELRYIIKHGAVLCKQYSRFNAMRNIPIIYTTINNIEKTEIVGIVYTRHTKVISI